MKKTLLPILFSFSLMSATAAQAMTEYGPTKPGDTAWGIAKRFRPEGASMTQMIAAIHRLNPSAFSGSNQLLALHATLQVPTHLTEVQQALTPTATVDNTPSPPAASPTAPATNVPTTAAPNISPSIPAENPAATAPQPTITTEITAPQSTPMNNSSYWGWVWFLLFVIALLFCLYQRKLFAPLKRQHHQASERAGTNRSLHSPHEISRYKTLGFTGQGVGNAAGEGTLIADLMLDMAEHRYDDAEKKLLSAIRAQKQNVTLRIKLLELYVATNNQVAFNRHAEYVLKNLLNENDPLWAKVRSMYLNKWVYDA